MAAALESEVSSSNTFSRTARDADASLVDLLPIKGLTVLDHTGRAIRREGGATNPAAPARYLDGAWSLKRTAANPIPRSCRRDTHDFVIGFKTKGVTCLRERVQPFGTRCPVQRSH